MSMIADDAFLRTLVDWAYLHATEGHTWPSTKTADELIALAKRRKPHQADASAMQIGVRWSDVMAKDGT